MSETEQLDILIRSIADGTGFSTSATQARAMNAEMAALGGSFHTHGATIATAERDISREADSMARALGAAGEQGGKAFARFEALGATMGSAGPLGIGIGAALVGFGAVYEGTKSAIENADKLEASTRSLSQAYNTQGQSLANQGAWIEKFLETNRRYIADQYAARNAIAELVRAGYDQVTVQRVANDALDLATAQGKDYTAAVTSLNKALQGSTIGLRDLGLSSKEVSAIMGQATADNKELAKANQDLSRDTTALGKAQDALHIEEDRLHSKRTVSIVDLDILHEKQKAVSDLTGKVITDQNALADAQGHVATTAEMQSTLLGILEPRLAKARDTTSELTQAQNNLNKAWQDASGRNGPALGQVGAFGLNALAGAVTGVDTTAHSLANNLAGDYPAHPKSPGGLLPFDPNMPDTPPPDLGLGVGGAVGIRGQRKKEFDDLLPSIQAVNLANQRSGDIASTSAGPFQDEREELGRMSGHADALKGAMYDLNVEHSSVSTKITEVIGKWRDEADAMDRFKYHGSDALQQTQVVFDGFVRHIRDEKLDLKLTVDTSAAQDQVSNFLEEIRNSRANVQLGTTSAIPTEQYYP